MMHRLMTETGQEQFN